MSDDSDWQSVTLHSTSGTLSWALYMKCHPLCAQSHPSLWRSTSIFPDTLRQAVNVRSLSSQINPVCQARSECIFRLAVTPNYPIDKKALFSINIITLLYIVGSFPKVWLDTFIHTMNVVNMYVHRTDKFKYRGLWQRDI